MTKIITATEAVRKFSEILNSIEYTGNDFTITRGGKPVATVRPVATYTKTLTLGDLPGIVRTLPALGNEAKRFKKILRKSVNSSHRCRKKTNGHNLRLLSRIEQPKTYEFFGEIVNIRVASFLADADSNEVNHYLVIGHAVNDPVALPCSPDAPEAAP